MFLKWFRKVSRVTSLLDHPKPQHFYCWETNTRRITERTEKSLTDTYYPCFRHVPIAPRQKVVVQRLLLIPGNGLAVDPSTKLQLNASTVHRRSNPSSQSSKQLVARGIQNISIKPEDSKSSKELNTYENSVKHSKLTNEKIQRKANKNNAEEDGEDVDQVLNTVRTTCPFCEKQFKDVIRLEVHVTNVHRNPNKLYKCDMCKTCCYSQRELEQHKVIHRPDYFFECHVCQVKYKREPSLKRHILRIHTEHDTAFICEHCGRSFIIKIDLTQHIKRCHDSTLQVCRFCGKEVKDLKGHEWKHEKRMKQTEYQYNCHLCTKKFRHRCSLDKHLMRHETNFTCRECGEECRGSKELLRHKRVKHGPTKVYNCILCRKDFYCTSNYYQHVLTHAGIRPYRCDICKEDFTQRSSLLRHRRQHPGPLPPFESAPPQVTEMAKNFLRKLQSGQIDKNSVFNCDRSRISLTVSEGID